MGSKECCNNCKHLIARDICMLCALNGKYIRFSRIMGGSKYCVCYERRKRSEKTPYPEKEK